LDKINTKTLAEIYLRQGHIREAYEILTTLANENPSDTEVRMKLIEVSMRLGSGPSLNPHRDPSSRDKIQVLEQWLKAIRKRRKA
jgi:hypothetical protein